MRGVIDGNRPKRWEKNLKNHHDVRFYMFWFDFYMFWFDFYILLRADGIILQQKRNMFDEHSVFSVTSNY